MAGEEARLDWLKHWAHAHRGLHDDLIPENSLAAFRAAMAAGLGIECDLRRSRDGRAMVFHDETLDRLTPATGPLAARSVGELTALRLGTSRETIPTLRDLLDLVDGKVPLLLELKTDAAHPVGPLCRAVRRDLEGYAGRLAVMGFDPRVVRWFHRHCPEVPVGLVVSEAGGRTLLDHFRRRLAIWQAAPDFLALDVRDLPSALAARARRKGLPLLAWTVCNAAQRATAEQAGAALIGEGQGLAGWQRPS